jgi:hypothetical protein
MKSQTSNELERVRIATALGWKRSDFMGSDGNEIWFTRQSVSGLYKSLPGYHNDANAALNICEFMTKKGAEILFLARKDWHVCMVLHCKTYTADANTLPSAICAAFCQYLDANEP